jgi:hypothetical protein
MIGDFRALGGQQRLAWTDVGCAKGGRRAFGAWPVAGAVILGGSFVTPGRQRCMKTLRQAPASSLDFGESSPAVGRWTPDAVVAALRLYHAEVGPPRYDAFRRPPAGFPSRKVVERRFGTWRAALDAAGLQAGRPAWTREAAVGALQAFSRRVGRPPLARELGSDTRTPSHSYLRAEFGSVAAAREAAGIGQPQPAGHDRQGAVQSLRFAALRLGQSPTERHYSGLGLAPCARMIRLQFGTWQNALAAAGLPPTRTRRRRQRTGVSFNAGRQR